MNHTSFRVFTQRLVSCRTAVLALVVLAIGSQAGFSDDKISIRSPSGNFLIELTIGEDGRPTYRVDRGGKPIITPSGLGFRLPDDVDWTSGFDRLELVDRGKNDTTWTPAWGERSQVRDHYQSAVARFHREKPAATIQLVIRAYNEGVAFRYVLAKGPKPDAKEIVISTEETEFRLTADHDLWAAYSAQGEYSKVPLSEIRHSVERPCVLEPKDGPVIAVSEAALVDDSRMRLRRDKGIAIHLAPRETATKFEHPGILHNRADLDFLRTKVRASESPWKEAWDELRKHSLSQLDRKPKPRDKVVRGAYNRPNLGANDFMTDGASAYSHALQWYVTEERKHAEKVVEILNAYATTLESIGGHDARLLTGMGGTKFLNAAEIIRHTSDVWTDEDQKRFEKMVRGVLYPVIENFFPTANGNWDASMIQTMLAMGVFLDDRAIFDRAVSYFLHGEGNGAVNKYFNHFGQCQESGRDQNHTQMGLGYLADSAEIAWKQGLDLYSSYDDRLLKGYEYTAKYNLGHEVPFETYTSVGGRHTHTKISPKGRGNFGMIWERAFHHYHHRRGLEMPFTKQVLEKIRPQRWQFEYASWASLTTRGQPN